MYKNYRMFFKAILALLFISLGCISYGQSVGPDHEGNIYSLGVGYGGGLGAPGIAYDLLPTYSGTISSGVIATYEHRFPERLGLGGFLSYSSASLSATAGYPAENQLPAGTLTDKESTTYIGIGSRAFWHFSNSNRFDPYAGVEFGYLLTSQSSTITNVQGSYGTHLLYSSLILGAVAGVKLYVSDSFGFWLELSYAGLPNYLASAGITYRIPTKF